MSKEAPTKPELVISPGLHDVVGNLVLRGLYPYSEPWLVPTFVNVWRQTKPAASVVQRASLKNSPARIKNLPPTRQEELVHSRRAEGVGLNKLSLAKKADYYLR